MSKGQRCLFLHDICHTSEKHSKAVIEDWPKDVEVLIVMLCRHPLPVFLISAPHMVPSSLRCQGTNVGAARLGLAALPGLWGSVWNWGAFMHYLLGRALCLLSFLVNSLLLSVRKSQLLWFGTNQMARKILWRKVMSCDASDNESWPHWMSQSWREVWLSRIQMLFTQRTW